MAKVTAAKEASPESTGLVISYDVTETAIAELRDRFTGLTFDTPANYEEGRKAIGVLRDLRGRVEKRRQDLKRDSLEFGRKVDAAAKTLRSMIEAIEDPLQKAKDAVDEAERQRKIEEEKAELLALDAKLKAEREAAEEKAKADREAEAARLAEERRKLDEEKARLAAETAAREAEQRAERERLDAQRREVEEQQRQVREREQAAAREREAAEARERAEREAREAEERAKAAAARAAELAPDIDKVKTFGADIRSLVAQAPKLDAPCSSAVGWAVENLLKIAAALDEYEPPV